MLTQTSYERTNNPASIFLSKHGNDELSMTLVDLTLPPNDLTVGRREAEGEIVLGGVHVATLVHLSTIAAVFFLTSKLFLEILLLVEG